MAHVISKAVSLYQGAFVGAVRAPLAFHVAVVVDIATNRASTRWLKGHIYLLPYLPLDVITTMKLSNYVSYITMNLRLFRVNFFPMFTLEHFVKILASMLLN